MRHESSALAVLHRAVAPSPTWAIEHELMSIGLADLTYASTATRTILRRARERAAAAAAPVERPTAHEIQEVLNDGDREARTQLLARILISELCHTKGSASLLEDGPEPSDEVGRGAD